MLRTAAARSVTMAEKGVGHRRGTGRKGTKGVESGCRAIGYARFRIGSVPECAGGEREPVRTGE